MTTVYLFKDRGTQRRQNFEAGTDVLDSPGSYQTTSITKFGQSVDSWRQKIREVQSATGTYSLRATNREWTRGIVTFTTWNTSKKRTEHHMISDVILLHGSIPNAPVLPSIDTDTEARIKFCQNYRNKTRSFSTGTFLGELRETIHMIRRPAEALRKAITTYSLAAKKAVRRVRNAKKAAKAITGTWLEHSFGWRPLFGDVDDGMKALAGLPQVSGEVVTGFSSTTYTGPVETYQEDTASITIKARFVPRTFGYTRYVGFVGYELSNSGARSWNQNWGITLSDFAPTAWELFPYSFLVDYFSNIGNVIDAASLGHIDCRWGSKSHVTDGSRLFLSAAITGNQYASSAKFQAGVCALSPPHLSNYEFVRTQFFAIDVGLSDIRVKVPGIDDWHKWANIAALAIEKVL